MGTDFKRMSYKDFHRYSNEVIERTFSVKLNSKNRNELIIKLKWYTNFIIYIIKNNKIERFDSFEPLLRKNKYFTEDADMVMKLFNSIREVLFENYVCTMVNDIVGFCERMNSELKVQ